MVKIRVTRKLKKLWYRKLKLYNNAVKYLLLKNRTITKQRHCMYQYRNSFFVYLFVEADNFFQTRNKLFLLASKSTCYLDIFRFEQREKSAYCFEL